MKDGRCPDALRVFAAEPMVKKGIAITMGFVIDIIIAAICAWIVFKAARNGLVKSVMGLAKGMVSFIAAYAFTPALGNFIYEKFALSHISGDIAESIASISKSDGGKFDLQKMFEEMPDALNQIINRYGVDEESLGEMCQGLTAGSEETVGNVANYIADPVAAGLSSACAFIILFVCAFVILSVVTFLVDAVFHLPVLHSANKLFGVMFGVAEAALFCVILGYGGAMLIRYLGSFDPELFGDHVVQNSVIMRFMSSIDLLGIAEGIAK